MLNVCPTCASTISVRTLVSEPALEGAHFCEMHCDACDAQWFDRIDDKPEECFVADKTPALETKVKAAKPVKANVEITAEAISSHRHRPSRTRFSIKPVEFKASPPPKKRRQALIATAFCLSTALVVTGAVSARAKVVRQLPQTAVLFKAIGLPVNLRGLDFRDVKTRIFEENGQRVLAVEGVITNVVKSDQPVPEMRVSLRGDDGREIYSWTAHPTQPKLNAGGTLLFRTRLASPPTNAHVALVNFADADATRLR